MRILDSVNAMLATLFAPDAKIDNAKTDIQDIKDAFTNDANSTFQKIADGLDELKKSYYDLLLSPEDIFSNRVQITNANIFSDKFDEDGQVNSSDWNLFNHLMKQLKQATASLYYITRNLALVILLSLLIYTGIRIVLASNVANEKAKWEEYLFGWLKALALVMFVHLIMIGIFYISDVITKGLMGSFGGDTTIISKIRLNFNDTSIFDATGAIVYLIMYVYITYMNIVFLISYFKRLFYIIVMVIVAPVISSLYALGKTGKERFDRWIKEFIMGVLVQPFQLLIYSVLFLIPMQVMSSSGFSLGSGGFKATYSTLDTQIFALIAMGMIRPIEKFMRSIFGFTGTALDNVASFESGKRTLDKGAEFAKQTVKTGVAIAGAVATGGASLATTGIPLPGKGGAEDGPEAGGGVGSTQDTVNQIEDEINKNNGRENNYGENTTETDNYYEENSDGEEKPRLGGQNLSTALLNKFGVGMASYLNMFGDTGKNLSAKLNLESLSESILLQPGMLEQYENLRQAAHGMTDTFYVDSAGSGGDWKNNMVASFIQDQKEQNEFNFINNEGNIEKAIKLFGIDKKLDDKDRPLKKEKQEELAKEKLKSMAPYSAMGITDLAAIKGLMDRNIKPEDALHTLKKDNKGTMNYNHFVENEENIQVMQNIEAEKLGLSAEFAAGNQTVIQQVNQQVKQTISDGRQYISSGAAKDSETLNRLVELERKIDSKVGLEGSRHISKEAYIPNIDKVIEKALKDGVKTIKLPINKKSPINDTIKQENKKAEEATKALEKAMNEVLEERRNAMPPPKK